MVVEILTLKSIYLIKLFKFSTALFNLQNRQLLTRTEGQFDRGIGTFVDSFVNMFKKVISLIYLFCYFLVQVK